MISGFITEKKTLSLAAFIIEKMVKHLPQLRTVRLQMHISFNIFLLDFEGNWIEAVQIDIQYH